MLRLIVLSAALLTNCKVSSICIGKHLRISDHAKRNISKIEYDKFSVIPSRGTYENTGETVLIKYGYDNIIPIMGKGPFGTDSYSLQFLYYHWFNESFMEPDELPAEVHIVFMNTRYKSLDKALSHDMGVVTASFKIKIIDGDKINLFHDIVKEILNPYQMFDVPPPATLGLFRIANFKAGYYIYMGKSLIPGKTCTANVIWMDFEEPLYIYRKQVQFFCNLMSFEGVPLMTKLIDYLPPKGRVFYAIDDYQYKINNWTATKFEGFNSASIINMQKIWFSIVTVYFCF